MRPIASARPGNVNVFKFGKRNLFYRVRKCDKFTVSKQRSVNISRPKDMILVFLIRDISLIIKEGCINCFKDNLQQDIDNE